MVEHSYNFYCDEEVDSILEEDEMMHICSYVLQDQQVQRPVMFRFPL